jgi:hypothetical protein
MINGCHPVRYIHIDQSPKGAQTLGDELFKQDWPAMSESRRWGIINVWQPLSLVRRDPLAVLARTTVDHADLVNKDLISPKSRTGAAVAVSMEKVYQASTVKYNPDHRWHWCSGMKREEVLFLRIFDSRDDGGIHGTPHTGIVVPGTQEEAARQSVETRCFVFW